MNIILSDIELPIKNNVDTTVYEISKMNIAPCIGCFGCWIKTPGECVLHDDAQGVCRTLAESERVMIVSHLIFGSYDVPIKTMLERSLPVQQAYICMYADETHHVQRGNREKDATVVVYGAKDEEEEKLFSAWLSRNSLNTMYRTHKILFAKDASDAICKASDEVAIWEN